MRFIALVIVVRFIALVIAMRFIVLVTVVRFIAVINAARFIAFCIVVSSIVVTTAQYKITSRLLCYSHVSLLTYYPWI